MAFKQYSTGTKESQSVSRKYPPYYYSYKAWWTHAFMSFKFWPYHRFILYSCHVTAQWALYQEQHANTGSDPPLLSVCFSSVLLPVHLDSDLFNWWGQWSPLKSDWLYLYPNWTWSLKDVTLYSCLHPANQTDREILTNRQDGLCLWLWSASTLDVIVWIIRGVAVVSLWKRMRHKQNT